MRQTLFPLLLVGLLSISACHAPVTIQTPAGAVAYTADQVVQRVNELQSAVITANSGGALPDATTRMIVSFCVAADKTLGATPSGWQATLTQAWQATKAQLPPITNPAVASAIGAVDIVLAALGS